MTGPAETNFTGTLEGRLAALLAARKRRDPVMSHPLDAPVEAATGQVKVLTFGCRLNAYESEVMAAKAAEAGLARAVIVNTLRRDRRAVRQARQAILKAARETPGAEIIVTAAAAQTEPETFARDGGSLPRAGQCRET